MSGANVEVSSTGASARAGCRTQGREPARPSGAAAGTYRPADHQGVEVLMDDGRWECLEAIGWARDISGAGRIKLLRYGPGAQGHHSTLEDWWLYDPARVRLVPDAVLLDATSRWPAGGCPPPGRPAPAHGPAAGC